MLKADTPEKARKIPAYTADMIFGEFSADEKTIDTVIRNFEMIGEAANRLEKEQVFTFCARRSQQD